MNNFAIRITDENKVSLFSKPIESKEDLDSLRKNLIENDNETLSKFHYYCPHAFAATTKTQNYVVKVLFTIGSFFYDLVSLPFEYSSRKQNLMNNISILKFLKDEKLPKQYLNTNRFNIQFITFNSEKEGKMYLGIEYNAIRLNTGIISLPLIDCGTNDSIAELGSAQMKTEAKELFEKAFVRA